MKKPLHPGWLGDSNKGDEMNRQYNYTRELKSFHEQKYPVTIEVLVRGCISGKPFTDQIKGLNIGHALYLAKDNWGCPVEFVRVV